MTSLLACPACHGALRSDPDGAGCDGCGARYPVDREVQILLGPDVPRHALAQAAAHDRARDAELEVEAPRGAPLLHGWLAVERFRRSVDGVEHVLRGATAVAVCGGAGMDAELLARAGARPVAIDVSLGATRRARERFRRRRLDVPAVVALAERLPLRDSSVDLAYVQDGLHHLEDPLAGLREMARVARLAVIVSEPTDSPVTRVAVRAGVATDVEEGGNRVARLDAAAAARELRAASFDEIRVTRYAMHYDPEVGRLARFLSRRRLAPAARTAAGLLAAAGRPVGNKLVVQAVRAA